MTPSVKLVVNVNGDRWSKKTSSILDASSFVLRGAKNCFVSQLNDRLSHFTNSDGALKRPDVALSKRGTCGLLTFRLRRVQIKTCFQHAQSQKMITLSLQ